MESLFVPGTIEPRFPVVPMSTLAVRLEGADIERLRERATEEGIGVTQLVRRWITDRLDDDDKREPVETISVAELRRFIRSHAR